MGNELCVSLEGNLIPRESWVYGHLYLQITCRQFGLLPCYICKTNCIHFNPLFQSRVSFPGCLRMHLTYCNMLFRAAAQAFLMECWNTGRHHCGLVASSCCSSSSWWCWCWSSLIHWFLHHSTNSWMHVSSWSVASQSSLSHSLTGHIPRAITGSMLSVFLSPKPNLFQQWCCYYPNI